jgi:hypothetical protein
VLRSAGRYDSDINDEGDLIAELDPANLGDHDKQAIARG